MYAATAGGAFSISAVDFSQDSTATNPAGFQSVVIGHSSTNTGTENPGGSFYPIIGGIGVTGTPVQTISIPSASGVTSISGSFTLNQNSLVVLVSAASNDNTPVSLSSPFVIDQQETNTNCNFGSGCGGVVLAHASMTAGSYSFTLAYTPVPPALQVPTAEAIGVIFYAFPATPTTTLQVSNLKFPGGTFVSLNDPFSSFADARTFAYNAATSGVPAQDNPPFGSVPFSLDVTNTGNDVAHSVIVNVVFSYPFTYSVCLEIAVACTSSITEQITQPEPTPVSDIDPGQTVTVTGVYTVQYASVMALVEAVTGTNIVFISLPGFATGAKDYATVQGSNTGLFFGVFPTLSGMNYGEVSFNTILGAASSYYGQTIAAYLNYGAGSLGKFLGFDTQFINQAGVMIEGGKNEFKNFFNVVSTVGNTVITAISNFDPPTFDLVATSPTGQIFQATSTQGVAQIAIQDPSPGYWEVDVIGISVQPGGAPFTLNVALGVRPSTTTCGSGVSVTSGVGLNLQGSNLAGCNLADFNLVGDNFMGANLMGADLQGANLGGSNLLGVNLAGANTLGTNFQGANLQGASLQGDDLANDNLQNANLMMASLQNSVLTSANLAGANLRGATLVNALLTGTSLANTDFNGANLLLANLKNAICGSPNYITASGANTNAQNISVTCIPPL